MQKLHTACPKLVVIYVGTMDDISKQQLATGNAHLLFPRDDVTLRNDMRALAVISSFVCPLD